jgi:hypothetical protein
LKGAQVALTIVVGLMAAAAMAANAPRDISGRWAMSWQTRTHGVQKSGYLLITQNGSSLTVVIQGQGEIRASGSIRGNEFLVEGHRMLMKYTITGAVDEQGVMKGSLHVATLDKPFSAVRER